MKWNEVGGIYYANGVLIQGRVVRLKRGSYRWLLRDASGGDLASGLATRLAIAKRDLEVEAERLFRATGDALGMVVE